MVNTYDAYPSVMTINPLTPLSIHCKGYKILLLYIYFCLFFYLFFMHFTVSVAIYLHVPLTEQRGIDDRFAVNCYFFFLQRSFHQINFVQWIKEGHSGFQIKGE